MAKPETERTCANCRHFRPTSTEASGLSLGASEWSYRVGVCHAPSAVLTWDTVAEFLSCYLFKQKPGEREAEARR